MRFMIIVKASPDSEAGTLPSEALMARMGAYHGELAKAGVLLDGAGLKSSSTGWRIHHDGKGSTVTDGPFTETRELIAGYTLIQVKSRAEAVEWARRYPSPAEEGQPGDIEVRQLFEMEDFAPGAA